MKWVAGVVIVLAVFWLAGFGYLKTAGGRGSFLEHPECPHEVEIINGADTVREISIAGPITNVPEFHDCQRLIQPGGNYTAGPVAIWVSEAIDQLFAVRADSVGCPAAFDVTGAPIPGPRQCKPSGFESAPANASVEIHPVAQVYNFGSDDYAPLGIRPQFSCVYLAMGAGRAGAWVIPTESTNACNKLDLRAMLRLQSEGTARRLDVQRYMAWDKATQKPVAIQHYPPTARWDWDDKAREQYIGVKCGAGWCELGDSGFTPSVRMNVPQQFAGSMTAERVFLIPGWHDRQYLAHTDPAGGLKPSTTMGTVVPMPGLDDVGTNRFTAIPSGKGFVFPDGMPVAMVYLSGPDDQYRTKMNFGGNGGLAATIQTAGPPGWISLVGWPADWSARIKDPSGTEIRRRLERREHKGLNVGVPGTTRWRWREDDETIWHACVNGCCEVAGPG